MNFLPLLPTHDFLEDNIFKTYLYSLSKPWDIIIKLQRNSLASEEYSLAKLSFLGLVLSEFSTLRQNFPGLQQCAECLWWLLDLIPHSFPEFCVDVPPLLVAGQITPQVFYDPMSHH
jgi:hypothetical protein